jgi:agmatinase
LYDYGDVLEFSKIEDKFKEVLSHNKFNLVLGGDHSVSIPTEKAFLDYAKSLNKTPVIIHIDAHPDICDFYDGSKNSHACTNMRAIDNGYKTEDITLVGIRGYEEQEVIYLDLHKELEVYNASYLNEYGFEKVLKSLFNKYKNSDKHLVYLSYDIDANDPSFAPGTGTPEAFGLNSIKLLNFIKELFLNLPIKVMDIVEVSPVLDTNNITSWLALKTIYEILGILSNERGK